MSNGNTKMAQIPGTSLSVRVHQSADKSFTTINGREVNLNDIENVANVIVSVIGDIKEGLTKSASEKSFRDGKLDGFEKGFHDGKTAGLQESQSKKHDTLNDLGPDYLRVLAKVYNLGFQDGLSANSVSFV